MIVRRRRPRRTTVPGRPTRPLRPAEPSRHAGSGQPISSARSNRRWMSAIRSRQSSNARSSRNSSGPMPRRAIAAHRAQLHVEQVGHARACAMPAVKRQERHGRHRASHGCPLGARFRAAAALRRLRDDRRRGSQFLRRLLAPDRVPRQFGLLDLRTSASGDRGDELAPFAWPSRRGSRERAPRWLMTNCRAASPSASNMAARSRSPGPWRATWRRWSRASSNPVLVPVPLHRARLWRRGFNQSALVAREISRRLGIAADPFLIRRIKRTPPLKGMSPLQRRKAVAGAFKVPDRSAVEGTHHHSRSTTCSPPEAPPRPARAR